MSVTEKKSILPDWTIDDLNAARIKTRERWEKEFEENWPALAEKISDSVTHKVFQAIQKQFRGFSALPNTENRVVTYFSLSLKRNVLNIINVAEDAAARPPFTEWLEAYKNGVLEAPSETAFSQSLMDQMGEPIVAMVETNLRAFTSKPENKSLQFKGKWIPYKASSDEPEDCRRIKIATWIRQEKNAC